MPTPPSFMQNSPASTTRESAVSLKGISFSRMRERILDGIDLEVAQGDFLALLGPNGGGKTTLLRLMLGLVRPDSGQVSIFGLPPEQARARIGYVPQFSTIRQEFPTTVLHMTLMGAARARSGFGPLWADDAAACAKARSILDTLGILDVADNPIHALSGGQRQRLLVARALMGRPAEGPFLLLLDEPTASIDVEGKYCFYEFLGSIRGTITIIVVSHDLSMASPFFSRVALLNKTLTVATGELPSVELLQSVLGPHAPDCPVSRIIHPAHEHCGCPVHDECHPPASSVRPSNAPAEPQAAEQSAAERAKGEQA